MNDVTTRSVPDSIRIEPAAAVEPARAHRRGRRWLLFLLGAAVLAACVYAWLHGREGSTGANPVGTPTARAVPVVAVAARQGDLQLYLDGLGTVTPFSTVTVRTRVDGELVKVAFAEGQRVHEGDLLVEIDARAYQVQLAQAEGQLAKDNALLTNARLDLKRYEEAREAVPRQQVDTASANVALYEGSVRVDQSQIDNAKLSLTYCRITAPVTGKIGLRLVDQGNMVHASDANGMAVITQIEPIAVQFSLPQDDLPRVLRALTAGELTAEAYDRDLKTHLASGKLLAVDNQIDTVTGTVRMKAAFDNADGALFPNQFVNVRLLVDTQRGTVLIPAAAVQRSPQSMFVYVVKPDDTVAVRPIDLGPTEGDITAVLKGLAAGEVVVTDGVDKLQEGTKVSVRAPGAGDGGHPDAASRKPGPSKAHGG